MSFRNQPAYKTIHMPCHYIEQMAPVPHPGMQQQAGFYMQQHSQGVMGQQPSGFPPQMAAMQFNTPPQAMMGGRSGGPMHGEVNIRGGSTPSDVWRGGSNSMQDGGGAGGGKDGPGGPEEAK